MKMFETTYLNHELWDHAVECTSLVSKARFSSTQSAKILCSLGCFISIKPHNYTTRIITTNGDIKINLYR